MGTCTSYFSVMGANPVYNYSNIIDKCVLTTCMYVDKENIHTYTANKSTECDIKSDVILQWSIKALTVAAWLYSWLTSYARWSPCTTQKSEVAHLAHDYLDIYVNI